MYSLIIPVYQNAQSLSSLLRELKKIKSSLDSPLEVVWVVDGSPDQSCEILKKLLPKQPYPSKLILLSRNFGSYPAITIGLAEAKGPYFAVMAADMQEPISLIKSFFRSLSSQSADIVFGVRQRREDPRLSSWLSSIFWFFYRHFVQETVPPGGIDVFGCNVLVRNQLLTFKERNTSLIGLLLWMGFRRTFITYDRRGRRYGRSAWTLRKKLRYFIDSMISLSDFPIYLILGLGVAMILGALIFIMALIIAKTTRFMLLPNFTTTLALVILFSGIHFFALGILGSYLWRTFENTKGGPTAIVMAKHRYSGRGKR